MKTAKRPKSPALAKTMSRPLPGARQVAPRPAARSAQTEYDDTNTIMLFRTAPESLQQNPKRPVLWGRINVDGEERQISLWKRDGQKGPFWSGTIQEIQGASSSTSGDGFEAPSGDSDIPF